MHAAVKGPGAARREVAQQRAQQADAAVRAVEGKLRGLEFGDRKADFPDKELRQTPLGAAPDQHPDDLVTVAAQHRGQRQRLGQVAAPLPLNDKEITHHRSDLSSS